VKIVPRAVGVAVVSGLVVAVGAAPAGVETVVEIAADAKVVADVVAIAVAVAADAGRLVTFSGGALCCYFQTIQNKFVIRGRTFRVRPLRFISALPSRDS